MRYFGIFDGYFRQLLYYQADAEGKGRSVKPIEKLAGNLSKWDDGSPLLKLHFEQQTSHGATRPHVSTSAIGRLFTSLRSFREKELAQLLHTTVNKLDEVTLDPHLARPHLDGEEERAIDASVCGRMDHFKVRDPRVMRRFPLTKWLEQIKFRSIATNMMEVLKQRDDRMAAAGSRKQDQTSTTIKAMLAWERERLLNKTAREQWLDAAAWYRAMVDRYNRDVKEYNKLCAKYQKTVQAQAAPNAPAQRPPKRPEPPIMKNWVWDICGFQ